MFVTAAPGADWADPVRRYFRADGNQVGNGFASSAQVEAEIASWYDVHQVGSYRGYTGRDVNVAATAAHDDIECASQHLTSCGLCGRPASPLTGCWQP